MEDLINQVKAELKIDDKKIIPIDDRSITQDELYDTLKMFQNDRHFTYLPIPFKMYKDFSCFDKMTIGTLTGTTNELPVHSLEDTFKYVEEFNKTDDEAKRVELTKERIKSKLIEKHGL